jgi:hypothetical protein
MFIYIHCTAHSSVSTANTPHFVSFQYHFSVEERNPLEKEKQHFQVPIGYRHPDLPDKPTNHIVG